MNTTTKQIKWTRISNDTNGNPRYVCHFFSLLSEKEKLADYADKGTGIYAACASLDNQYKFAIKRAKTIGGRKFHNKKYGGGIVFQSFNIQDTERQIKELIK